MRMKRVVLALLLVVAGSAVAWADGIPQVVRSDTPASWTRTVYNDSAGTIVSGAPVVWDTDDTEYDNSGFPYITTTTTADDIDTAGVMLTGSCPDQQLCEIVVRGWAATRVSVATLTEDTVVSTSTTVSSIGDATAGNNVCYLGVLKSYTNVGTGNTCTTNQVCLVPVDVNITCVP